MVLRLLTLVLVGDVFVGPDPNLVRPKQPPAACTQDGDCVLSTFDGCCGSCCTPPPHAVAKGVNEGARCAAIDCARPRCEAVRCARPEPLDAWLAICRAGQCVAVKKPVAPAVCRVDSDCRVAMLSPPPGAACYQSPCGCCPSAAAVPVDSPVPAPPPKRRAPATDSKGPTFGLSTGDGPAPPRLPPPDVNCSPCPGGPAGVRAACVGGRCELAPRPLPPG